MDEKGNGVCNSAVDTILRKRWAKCSNVSVMKVSRYCTYIFFSSYFKLVGYLGTIVSPWCLFFCIPCFVLWYFLSASFFYYFTSIFYISRNFPMVYFIASVVSPTEGAHSKNTYAVTKRKVRLSVGSDGVAVAAVLTRYLLQRIGGRRQLRNQSASPGLSSPRKSNS